MSETGTKKEGIIGRFFKSDCERRLAEARQLMKQMIVVSKTSKRIIFSLSTEEFEELRKKLG